MDKHGCGQIVVAALLVALVVVALELADFWWRWQAADRDAARCVRAGANPVVMSDGRVECWK